MNACRRTRSITVVSKTSTMYLLLLDVRPQALDLTAMRLARRRRSVLDVPARRYRRPMSWRRSSAFRLLVADAKLDEFDELVQRCELGEPAGDECFVCVVLVGAD